MVWDLWKNGTLKGMRRRYVVSRFLDILDTCLIIVQTMHTRMDTIERVNGALAQRGSSGLVP